MQLVLSEREREFRDAVRSWLSDALGGQFAHLRGRGGPGDEHYGVEDRKLFGREMGRAGWNCIGWPKEHGGRAAALRDEVIFNEEYIRAGGPGRIGHIGETLLGPTLIHFGTREQQLRFLPRIVDGSEIWCQGYSEPNAGSDLANVQTRAELRNNEWVIEGQKVWTSMAEWADLCFVLCRTNQAASKHQGLSYLLVPMKQRGVTVRPIEQMSGGAEFAEVYFDGATTDAGMVVGGVDNGWKVAMATLAFERGASTLGQQHSFQLEFDRMTEVARRSGRGSDPVLRQRIAMSWIELQIMRIHAIRNLSEQGTELGRGALVSKLYWSNWHRDFGKLAMDVLGPESELLEGAAFQPTAMQRTYLFARADTIYAGTNEIQRNLIAQRGLGLPREPK